MKHFRIATIVLSCAGVLFNAIVTTSQLAFMWHNFRSEQVSEREDIQRYMVETGSAFWGFFLLYFLASAGVCFTAFIAALEHCPSRLRAVRQVCLVDAGVWIAGLLALCLLAGSRLVEMQSFVCEALSHQPDLMRAIDGLVLESCESWAERGIVSLAAFMTLVTIVKVQYVLTITFYCYQLPRYKTSIRLELMSKPPGHCHSNMTRIYLLPNQQFSKTDLVVYVPLNLTSGDGQKMNATERWVSASESTTIDTIQLYGHVHLGAIPESKEGLLFPEVKPKPEGDMMEAFL